MFILIVIFVRISACASSKFEKNSLEMVLAIRVLADILKQGVQIEVS